jgi:hypothetical protein
MEDFMFIVHVIEILFLLAASWGFASLCFVTKYDVIAFATMVASATIWLVPAYPHHTLLISLAAVACVGSAFVRSQVDEFRIWFAPPLWIFTIYAVIMIVVKILCTLV